MDRRDRRLEGYIITFSGHRPPKLGGYGAVNPIRDRLKEKLERRLLELRVEHPDLRCITGMALGFDQWAAQVCIKLGIPFIAAVPFAGQESTWPQESQDVYLDILSHAEEVVVVSDGGYAPWKMQVRNEWMVERCNRLIVAWDKSAGGTMNCLVHAQELVRAWENLLPLAA